MKQKNLTYAFLGIINVVIGFIAKAFYRPYAYGAGFEDFGLADALPSFFYVIGLSLLLLLSDVKYPWLVIIMVSLGSVGYEYLQSLTAGTIDNGDLIASLAGGLISLLIWKIVDSGFTR
jgi:hypothetical protein